MVRTVLYVLFFFVFYYVFKLSLRTLFDPGTRKKTDPGAEELVQDPCCLTYISKRVALKKRVSGRDFYFCREECLKKYLEARGSSKI